MKTMLFVLLVLCILVSCSEPEKSMFIDEFEENKIGWIEEKAQLHDLEILDGKYIVEHKDSSSLLTSTKYLDKSWHYNLPFSYSVSSSIIVSGENEDSLFCGLIMECNSYLYEFTFFSDGQVDIAEYNYQTEETLYLEGVGRINATNEFDFSVSISEWDFELSVNGTTVAKDKLRCKNWNRIVPFTGRFTRSEIEYLKLMEISE